MKAGRWSERRAKALAGVRVLALCLLAVAAMPGSADEVLKDLPNAKDPPLLSRFVGSTLVGYTEKSFDEAVFPLTNEVKDNRFVKAQSFEGKVTQVAYLAPAGKSRLEVQRNYQEALVKAGFVKKFSCDSDACNGGTRLVQPFIEDARRMRQLKSYGGYSDVAFLIVNTNEAHYIWGTITADGRENAVSVLISRLDASDGSPLKDRIGIFVQVVEPKAMQGGQVAIDVGGLQKGLAADGKIALYGIYFDTGKADVKPESKPQLDEIAKLIADDRSMKVYIVGHTDNQGTVEANVALSQRRADAIVAALVRDYKVDAKRLAPKGVASYAPVATNETEAGRARNRRVELVRQ